MADVIDDDVEQAILRLWQGTNFTPSTSGGETIGTSSAIIPGSGLVGPQGPPGAGVAGGGVAGQALLKKSNANYDTVWGSIAGGAAPYATAALPSAGNAGKLYLTTDQLGRFLLDDGTNLLRISQYTVNAAQAPFGMSPSNSAAANTTALNAAISAVSTYAPNGGGTVFIPEGTYQLGTNPGGVKALSNVSLQGAGRGVTLLQFAVTAQGQVGLEIDGSSTVKTNVSIRGLSILSANAAYSSNTVLQTGIYLVDAASGAANTDVTVEDCEIYYCAYAGIGGTNNGAGFQRLHVRRSYFHDIGTSTMALAATPTVASIQGVQGGDLIYVDNDFVNVGTRSTDWAIYQARSATGIIMCHNKVNGCASGLQCSTSVCSNCIINDNEIQSCTAGDALYTDACKNSQICHNTVKVANPAPSPASGVITVNGSSSPSCVLVSDNTIDCNGQNVGTGVILINGSGLTNVDVHDNTIRNALSGSGATYGIYVLPTGGASINRVKIHHNTIESVVYGIYLYESASGDVLTDCEVTENTINSVSVGVRILGTTRTRVEGNRILCASSGSVAAIYVADGSGTTASTQHARVRRNVISKTNGGTASDLISFAGTNCIYEDNETTTQPVATSLQSNSGNVVRRNFAPTVAAGTYPVAKITSGATPSLGSWTLGDEMVQLSYPTPTTITGFTGGFPNERRTLQFPNDANAGNVTLQNGTSLVLKGALNVTPAANSILRVWTDGTNWYEEGRNF